MESRFDRRELLFQPRGIPPLGTSLSLALQHLVAMIVGCVTPPIIIAGAIGLSQEEQVLLIQASLVMSAVCTFLQLYPIGGHYRHGGVHHWPLPLPYRHQLHGWRHRQHL